MPGTRGVGEGGQRQERLPVEWSGFFFFLEEVGFEGGYESWEVCREELREKHGKRKRDV